MKINKLPVLFAAAFPALFFSCKNDHIDQTETGTGIYVLHLHSNIDTNEIELGNIYRDADGRQIKLTTAQFYISNIRLKKTDGTYYTIDSTYILKTVAEEEYVAGNVPAGDYTTVSFDVGVDATANHSDPSSFPAANPLSLSGPDTWYGNTAQGYIFMNIEGMVDTTASQMGVVDFPISYQIGSDDFLQTITMPDQPFTVVKDHSWTTHITCDYGIALQGIDFKTEPSTTSYTAASVAAQIAANIAGMFSYEE